MITVKERRAEDLQVDTGRAGGSWFLRRAVCSSKRQTEKPLTDNDRRRDPGAELL